VRILGLDTATRATAVALLDTATGAELEARDDPPPGARPRHTTRLMSLIVELLEGAGGGWPGVDRIAVGVGPGTFTGLRIGVATARALAQARSIPLVGVSTLEALAVGALAQAGEDVAVGDAGNGPEREAGAVVVPVLDARRGEVFAAAWPANRPAGGAWRALLQARATSPQTLRDDIRRLGPDTLAVGDGAIEFRAVLERSGARIPEDRSRLHRVGAINHCRLAEAQAPRDPFEVRPEYLRLPDAEIALRAAQRQ
jgi:tRNA threonylcarbamoyladenosine biosynthesis protein TsaB